MKVMFDSNTWRKVIAPDDFNNELYYNHYKTVHESIESGKIEAYLSETIFTTEAIVRKKRQGYFARYSPKVTTTTKATCTTTNMTFVLGPNMEDAVVFDESIKILKHYFDLAVQMSFRIVRLPRIGGLVNPEVEKVLYQVPDFKGYMNKATEVSTKIEANSAGFSWLKEIGEQYDTNWLDGIKKSPETECKKIAKAAAEWADGESVSISIGLGCDYFCTNDKARGAGQKSVFSQNNLSWLESDYNFKTVDIPTLASMI